MMQPTRLGPRKTVQLLVALTLLAWATQTLFSQWGFGRGVPATTPTTPATPAAELVEVRVEATIDGGDVTLKQLCRWSDYATLAQHGDLVVAKLSKESPVQQIGIAEIKSAMEKAGANLSQVQFAGAASCAVRRSEVDDATFARLLEQNGVSETSGFETGEVTEAPIAETPIAETPIAEAPRAEAPAQAAAEPQEGEMEVAEAPAPAKAIDEPVVSAVDPLAPAIEAVEPPKIQQPAPVAVAATKPALRTQLVLTRPLSAGQKIIASDLTTQVLTNADDAVSSLTDPNAIIGQLAAGNMKRGDVLTARSVKPAPLVTTGQFVTVSMPHGGATIETVARAMEAGIKGQTIKAKNEATGEIYAVIVTAPATGKLTTAVDSDSSDIASTLEE